MINITYHARNAVLQSVNKQSRLKAEQAHFEHVTSRTTVYNTAFCASHMPFITARVIKYPEYPDTIYIRLVTQSNDEIYLSCHCKKIQVKTPTRTTWLIFWCWCQEFTYKVALSNSMTSYCTSFRQAVQILLAFIL